MNDQNLPLVLAETIAQRYGAWPQVVAVALGGSHVAGAADWGSDIDLYVYTAAELPMQARAEIATGRAEYVELDNRFWEPGDEWIDAETGMHVDVMFRSVAWIEAQLERVLEQHQASVGYSTCLWHNVVASQALYDRDGWFEQLQQAARRPYPEPLRRAIIQKNHPILRRNISSYRAQLEKAVVRSDWVSINHRTAELLSSYFDILFALNRKPHPGEKRLVATALKRCERVPPGIAEQVQALVSAVGSGAQEIVERADVLIAGLDALLHAEGLLEE